MKKYIGMIFAFLLIMTGNVWAANTNSILFNGTSQYLSISDSTQSGLDITGNMVICAKFNTTSNTNYGTLVSKFSSSDNQRSYRLLVKGDTVLFQCDNTGTSASSASWTVSLSNNTWYSIALLYQTNGSATLFLNNVAQSTKTGLPTSIFNGSAPFIIGKTPDTGWEYYFNGKIDDVRVFNITLSASEITNYDTANLSPSTTGLVTAWNFNILLSGVGAYTNTLTNNGGVNFSSDVPYSGTTTTTTTTDTSTTTTTTTTTNSNPITTVINQGVAVGLTIGTSQQYLVVGKDASSNYYLAVAETTGTFIKSITLTTGYVPISVTQVVSGGVASTNQISVLSTNASKFYNLLVNTTTGAITPVAW